MLKIGLSLSVTVRNIFVCEAWSQEESSNRHRFDFSGEILRLSVADAPKRALSSASKDVHVGVVKASSRESFAQCQIPGLHVEPL